MGPCACQPCAWRFTLSPLCGQQSSKRAPKGFVGSVQKNGGGHSPASAASSFSLPCFLSVFVYGPGVTPLQKMYYVPKSPKVNRIFPAPESPTSEETQRSDEKRVFSQVSEEAPHFMACLLRAGRRKQRPGFLQGDKQRDLQPLVAAVSKVPKNTATATANCAWRGDAGLTRFVRAEGAARVLKAGPKSPYPESDMCCLL